MVLVIAAVLLAVVLLVGLISTVQSTERAIGRRTRLPRDERLPAGADAALWSIVEAVPDPRNHLALTRDLTGEVRIAGTVLDTSAMDAEIEAVDLLDEELVVNTITPPPRPTPAGGASVRIIGRIPDAIEDAPAEDRPLDVAS